MARASRSVREHVSALIREIEGGGDLPPLIVHCTAEGLELNDGNHRLEAYRRLGIGEGWAVFWATRGEEDFFPPFLTTRDARATIDRKIED